jgi:transcription elongation GreA/GreB family factor
MPHLFLPADFERVNAQIEDLVGRMKALGQEMGLACQEGAETFHDNFAYEDGERQQRMWGERLRQLIQVRNNAIVVSPTEFEGVVSIGRRVTVRDVGSGEFRSFRVGSYWVFDDRDGSISYQAPIVRPLLGARVGELRESRIGGALREFEIVAIE